MRPKSTARIQTLKLEEDRTVDREDLVAVEEPLEIRIGARSVAVTMRTPGHDFELAAGFLVAEGIVKRPGDLRHITYCTTRSQQYNVVTADLAEGVVFDPSRLERHVLTSSACGVCGTLVLESLRVRARPLRDEVRVDPDVLHGLEATVRAAQPVFDRTGALHAAALLDATGRLLWLREDVGRHNAVDKAVGAAFLEGRLPLSGSILMVSGRSSFEILQKALVAGVPVVASVGGPSSLAVDLAREFGITLVGFLRGRRANVYAGGERIAR